MKPIVNQINDEIEKLPMYWKLATFRCCLYSIVSFLTAVASGLGAYKYWHEITWIERFIIFTAGVVSMLNTIVAFLDTTLQKIAPSDTQSVTISKTQAMTVETTESSPKP